MSQSIDDIWTSMNGLSSDSIPKKKEKKRSSINTKQTKKSHSLPVPPNSTKFDFTEVSSSIAMLINSLSDSDSLVRKKALSSLRSSLFDTGTLTSTDYSKLFREICKPLFKRFADPTEKCRELSQIISKEFFIRSNDISAVLGYYFPALMNRLPTGIAYDDSLKIFVTDLESHDAYKRGRAVNRQDKSDSNTIMVVEPSEEIRLLCCETLYSLLSKVMENDASQILHAYFEDIIMFLQTQLRDPYPELKQLSCAALELTAKVIDFEVGMKYYSVALVRTILPLFKHRHAKVRAAAVSALHYCLIVRDREKCKAAGSEAIQDLVGFREENIVPIAAFYKSDIQINYLAEIVSDNSPIVREKLVSMLQSFLTEIGDRYDHQTRLLPYLLDLLTDPVTTISTAALNCLLKCGQQYEEEHADEIIERRQYGIDGDDRINLDKPLPYPFMSRPRIGVRLYVRGNTKRFLSALVNELSNWVAPTRIKSANLLKMVIVLCEEHLTIDTNTLLPSLLKALRFAREDRDTTLQISLLEVFELLGRYLLPDIYVFYLLPRLRGEVDISQAGDTEWKICIMLLLKSFLTGSKSSQIAPHFESIVSVLCDNFVIPLDSAVLQTNATELLQELLENLRGNIIEAHYLSTGRLTSFRGTIGKIFRFAILQLSKDDVCIKASNLLNRLSEIQWERESTGLQHLFMSELRASFRFCTENYPINSSWNKQIPELQLLFRIVECPFNLFLTDNEILKSLLTFLIGKVKETTQTLADNDLQITLLESFGNILFKVFTPISLMEYDMEELKYFEILYGYKPFGLVGLNNAKTKHLWLNSRDIIVSFLDEILEFFIFDHHWNLCNELLHRRIELVKLLIAKIDGISVLMPTNTMVKIFPKLIHALLPQGLILQTTPSSIRLETIRLFHNLVTILRDALGFTKIVSFKTSKSKFFDTTELKTYISGKSCVQEALNLLILAINDCDDSVRICALESLSTSIVFVMNEEEIGLERELLNVSDGKIRYDYTAIVKSLLMQLRLEFSDSQSGRGLFYLDYLDQTLRVLGILDPEVFESLLRSESSQILNDDFISSINGLINHSDLIKALSLK